MLEYDYTLPQIIKLFSKGEYTEIKKERASPEMFSFTIIFKFAGESEAYHIHN